MFEDVWSSCFTAFVVNSVTLSDTEKTPCAMCLQDRMYKQRDAKERHGFRMSIRQTAIKEFENKKLVSVCRNIWNVYTPLWTPAPWLSVDLWHGPLNPETAPSHTEVALFSPWAWDQAPPFAGGTGSDITQVTNQAPPSVCKSEVRGGS